MTTTDVAASLAEAALGVVLGAELVAGLRKDSPLAGVGLSETDHVCLSDAVAAAASAHGADCVLEDADLSGVQTVGDLIAAIRSRIDTAGST